MGVNAIGTVSANLPLAKNTSTLDQTTVDHGTLIIRLAVVEYIVATVDLKYIKGGGWHLNENT